LGEGNVSITGVEKGRDRSIGMKKRCNRDPTSLAFERKPSNVKKGLPPNKHHNQQTPKKTKKKQQQKKTIGVPLKKKEEMWADSVEESLGKTQGLRNILIGRTASRPWRHPNSKKRKLKIL